MKIRIENNPELALVLIQKAGMRMNQLRKKRQIPPSWMPENLNMDYMVTKLGATKNEFIVVYADELPIAAGLLQRKNKLDWAIWPAEKPAVYGHRYAGNPDVPIAKTKIIFDVVKRYAASIRLPVIRIDIAVYETVKLRLYEAQGFKQVALCKNPATRVDYILLEYDPENP